MMKLKSVTVACLALAFAPQAAHAQTETPETDWETEEMVLPEGMSTAETDLLLQEWYTRNYLTFDENCDPSAVNPEYTKEEYISRLSRMPNVIDMPYNDVVRKYIDQYSGRLRRTVSIMLGTSNFYNPIFEEALEAYQLPLELKYLPVIESALNPMATSRVGAVGLWQFMITTGKQYGLEVTSLVDERRDPIKASYAAARYLKDLYGIFGDWALVIASYNCGPNNVNKAIKRAGGVKDYWKIYPYLPRETRGYVPAFIAANYIMNYYCDHNICPVNTQLPAGTDTVMVSRDVRFEQIHELCGISMDELKALNPQYRTSLVPGSAKPSPLRLNAQAMVAFLEHGDSIYTHRAAELFAQVENAVEVEEVPADRSSRSTRGNRRTASRQRGRTVTIRKGDNLGAIAKRNGTTVAQLRKLNGLQGSSIRAGQKLRVN